MNRLFKLYITTLLSIACIHSVTGMEQKNEDFEMQGLQATQAEFEVDQKIESLLAEIADINDEIDLNPREILMDHGQIVFRINRKNSKKETTTLLTMAIEGGSFAMVQKLLASGASIDDIPNPVKLVVKRSAGNDFIEDQSRTKIAILRELLKYGLPKEAVFVAAFNQQDLDIVKIMVEEYGKTVTDQDVAQAACPTYKKEPDLTIILYLRSKSTNGIGNILGKFDNLWQPGEQIVEFFLKNGAHVNAVDNMDEPYLFKAIRASNFAMVALLVKYDADVNKANRYHLPLDLVNELIKNPSLCTSQHDENLKKIKKLLKEKGAKGSGKCLLM